MGSAPAGAGMSGGRRDGGQRSTQVVGVDVEANAHASSTSADRIPSPIPCATEGTPSDAATAGAAYSAASWTTRSGPKPRATSHRSG